MLIKLLEVDVYDEEEGEEEGEDRDPFPLFIWMFNLCFLITTLLHVTFSETSEVTTPVTTQWPDIEEVQKLPFDPCPRDPKFRRASPVYADKMPKSLKGQQKNASSQ